jgi:lactate permease
VPPPTPPPLLTVAAVTPLALLVVLVLRTRMPLATAGWASAGLALLLAMWPFRLESAGLVAAAGKGVWTGVWIMLIVVPALLLYEIAEQSGALGRLAGGLERVAPTPGRRLLLGAWTLPAFIQGAAGFGTPIAVAAPMLVRTGMTPVAAVAACLVGYHWAVTFGSMGSSYFVAVGTARLDAAAAAEFALRVAVLLVVNCFAAGLLVLRGSEGAREAVAPALLLGAVMSVALVATVVVQPALGSTVAGLAGLIAAWFLLPGRSRRDPPHGRSLAVAAAPYLVLTVAVTVGFGVPGVREAADAVPAIAPAFPVTAAAYGHRNPPVDAHQPFRPLGHPAAYVLLAAAVGVVIYRKAGWWQPGTGQAVLRAWLRRSAPTAASIVGLTVLAAVMVEAGMVVVMADRLAAWFGLAYAALAASVGTAGTVLTGSTTASNALLAPLQARAAEGIGLPAPLLLAAQAAGGNVGNMLAPVNILVGAVAAGCAGREGDVIRATWRPALLLTVLIVGGVAVQAAFVV